jgi:hypothetical protein
VAGAADPNPVVNPLAAPTISGEVISVDILLQQPTRITAFLLDLTLEKFLLDIIFTDSGGVTGGAVVYDQIVANDLYTTNDVQSVAPNTEFPIVSSGRRAPKIAPVQKYGGKFFFSDEARDRNDASAFRNEATRLGNTIVRKMNVVAVAALEAAITANGGNSNFTGHKWETAIPNGATPTAPSATPSADLANAQLLAEQAELGVDYTLLVLNPLQLTSMRNFYSMINVDIDQVFEDNGFTDGYYASNRVAAGTAYAVAAGQVGGFRVEQPLGTETWREQGKERTWVQSSVRPVVYVTNPFGVMKMTGL